MHGTHLLSAALLGAASVSAASIPRQATLPTFCTAIDPAPSVAETKARAKKFAHAFVVTKNLEEAFGYISGTTYTNHNPIAEDGAEFAYNLLSQFWPVVNFTDQRTAFESPQSWVGYNIEGMGNASAVPVVDRFRWEAGCIVEHWDAGEVFPSK